METANDVIEAIVEIAKQKIKRAGCSSVDSYAMRFCELLLELGYEDEALEVEAYYKEIWG